MATLTKKELVEKLQELGVTDANEDMTKTELEALFETHGAAPKKAGDGEGFVRMLLSVQHDGTFYKKDEVHMLETAQVALFVEQGFAEEVEPDEETRAAIDTAVGEGETAGADAGGEGEGGEEDEEGDA